MWFKIILRKFVVKLVIKCFDEKENIYYCDIL